MRWSIASAANNLRSANAVVSGQGGAVILTDGPFAEAKEVLGGYAVLEAVDMLAASALARQFLDLHIKNGVPNIVLELREIAGGVNY